MIRIKKFINLFIDPNDPDGFFKFEIIDQETYDLFSKPMKIYFEEQSEPIEIPKSEIPVCDFCNDYAEYAQFWDIISEDGNVEDTYFENCLCEKCANKISKEENISNE